MNRDHVPEFWDYFKGDGLNTREKLEAAEKLICGKCGHLGSQHDLDWYSDCTDPCPCPWFDPRETKIIEEEFKIWKAEMEEYAIKQVEDYEAKHRQKWYW